ncbi:phage minor head protein [Bombella saccharophila]|uniref:Phage minor head protein n=1 Tax=Bombella saccharophila TaxID=2967338 RepID=A0ABT3W7Y4_9PROT|nr:phage minor head protein [Bombella saccharophila]MCX5614430.1 phage minor head protein [Bombella saccharophila]
MAKLRAPGKPVRLAKGRVNAGVGAAYYERICLLIKRMHRDTLRTIQVHYRRAEPELAQDANPVTSLRDVLRKLRNKWSKLFNEQAEALAETFIKRGQNDAEGDLRRRLNRAGFGITFKPDADLKRKLSIATEQNVALIKSIGEQYQDRVQAVVTNTVTSGSNLGKLTTQLEASFGISTRRAAMIARDQSHKINQSVERERATGIGLKEAYWRHVGGGRHPREDHVKADGRRYFVAEGCKISGEYIQPGELINCHCRAEYIIPGYND